MRRALLVALLLPAFPLGAQQNADTARSLDAVVVTAERARTPLSGSIASVTRLSSADLARTPRATFADLLRRAPGFTVIDFDGLGFDPQIMTRGFYGGGEAEYIVVLIDGRPVSQLQTGLVAWDVLPPLTSIESIEIVRGSSSPTYGDAAIGGVINVITRSAVSHQRLGVSGGSFGTLRASLGQSIPMGEHPLTFGGGIDRTDGFREHSRRTSMRGEISRALKQGAESRLGFTARAHSRSFDEPGPLLASLMTTDRTASDPIFRFDHTSDHGVALGLDGDRRVASLARLSGSIGGERRGIEAVRTLALAPGFGDTKLRRSVALRGAADLQLDVGDTPLPGTESFVLGGVISHGTVESKYYNVTGGPRATYATASGNPGTLQDRGNASRAIGSLHGQYNLLPSEALRIGAGARLDMLRDHFRLPYPSPDGDHDATHTALSPRIGANLRYLNNGRGSGNAYVTVSRSFKAPTLDQLYDLRSIPVPFDPFSIRTSNPELKPQTGKNLEAGLYHSLRMASMARAGVSISGYQMDMTNELDFDVSSFKYVNIGQSRHRGLEAGANVASGDVSVFANYALQDATSRSGANSGKRLKAIPRHTLSAGVSGSVMQRIELSLLASSLRGMYLDDDNSVVLPDYTRIDARTSIEVRGVSVFADARNLFDAKYSSSGFLDPAGTGEAYYYPTAGRVFEIGVRRGW